MPPEIVRDVWTHLIPGGAFIVVEKMLGSTADLDTLIADCY